MTQLANSNQKKWTFGVPNDVFVCPLDPGSSLIVGHHRTAEQSFRISTARASVSTEERGFDYDFRAPGRGPAVAGRLFTPLEVRTYVPRTHAS